MKIFVWSRNFGVFLKGNGEITYHVLRKDLMDCYVSLSASTSDSTFCLCLDNFAMSSVRFIVPRIPYQYRTALPVIWSLSNTTVLWLGSWDLTLNCWACLWSHTFASAVTMCSRALLVPTWYWIWGFWWEKKDPGAAGRGILKGILMGRFYRILRILYFKWFSSNRASVPGGKVHTDWGIQLMHLKCYSTNSFSSLSYCNPRHCM